MKYLNKIKLSILLLGFAISFSSCVEKIEDEMTLQFAKNVVIEITEKEIIKTIEYLDWVVRANSWLGAVADEQLQNEIEDKYFGKMEPRISGDTIFILCRNQKDIRLIHNNINLYEENSEWRVIKENFNNRYEFVVSYNGNVRQIKKIAANNDVLCNITYQLENKKYLIQGSGHSAYVFTNSPVVKQNYFINNEIEVTVDNDMYNSNILLCGNHNIELIDVNSILLSEDNIDVEYYNNFNYYSARSSKMSPAEPNNIKITYRNMDLYFFYTPSSYYY